MVLGEFQTKGVVERQWKNRKKMEMYLLYVIKSQTHPKRTSYSPDCLEIQYCVYIFASLCVALSPQTPPLKRGPQPLLKQTYTYYQT